MRRLLVLLRIANSKRIVTCETRQQQSGPVMYWTTGRLYTTSTPPRRNLEARFPGISRILNKIFEFRATQSNPRESQGKDPYDISRLDFFLPPAPPQQLSRAPRGEDTVRTVRTYIRRKQLYGRWEIALKSMGFCSLNVNYTTTV